MGPERKKEISFNEMIRKERDRRQAGTGGGFGTERGTEWESEEGTLISNSAAVAVQVLAVRVGNSTPVNR